MNEAYVKELSKPNGNEEAIHKDAKELITDYTFNPDIISYAIDNFLEATEAYYDDYDPNKLYYMVQLQDKTRNLCFDIENLAHLLGLPNHTYLLEATIINKKLTTKLSSKNWLTAFKNLFINNKSDIVIHDSNPDNESLKKLNWDKIATKVFCFLNIGILSQGNTFYYRHNVSKNNVKDYVLIRNIISKDLSGQIRIQLTTQKLGNEEILVPTSIMFEENAQKSPRISMLGRDYVFAGKVTITQKKGGNYGR